jgi:hypothetical protein
MCYGKDRSLGGGFTQFNRCWHWIAEFAASGTVRWRFRNKIGRLLQNRAG